MYSNRLLFEYRALYLLLTYYSLYDDYRYDCSNHHISPISSQALGLIHVHHLRGRRGVLGRFVLSHAQEPREAQRDALARVHVPRGGLHIEPAF